MVPRCWARTKRNFQLAQLVGQHTRGDTADLAKDVVEAQCDGPQMKKNDQFPFPVDQTDRRLDRAASRTVEGGVPDFCYYSILFDTMGFYSAY
jgi:hypothetical protein